MIRLKALDDLAHRLSELLPPGLEDARTDVEKNFRAVLHSGFSKLDLVTREEFDVQRAVLARTRSQLDELRALVEQLETQLAEQVGSQAGNRDGTPPPHA
jgi:BMFP domain-containing protein YqiC